MKTNGRDKNDMIIVHAEIKWVKTAGDIYEFGVQFVGLCEEEAGTFYRSQVTQWLKFSDSICMVEWLM